ncbi:IS3 family transposase [Streptomyces sp. NPDC000348]|uniref:IS3 family transposase n=1 Tax=Streptomyces sp. NPDC000348 TaxID=3364538 RepID=UPI0036799296
MRSRFQFVDDHRDAYEVNRSSYYKWLVGAEARAVRRREDRLLAEKIRQVHGESGGAYGSPRVTAELRVTGLRVNEKRVARVMRAFSITGIRLRRRVRTTVPDPATTQVPDLFQRDFTVAEPGRKYMGDITYLPSGTAGSSISKAEESHSSPIRAATVSPGLRTTQIISCSRAWTHPETRA